MIATDLDGTLLGTGARLSARNRRTLEDLGARGILRVVATGRSGFSARRVLAPDFPIDYLVVSSGAGIIDWRTGAYLRAMNLEPQQTASAVDVLLQLELDFMVHDVLPDNHRFAYHRVRGRGDFDRRVERYRDHCAPGAGPWQRPACQLVAIHDAGEEAAPEVRRRLPELWVVRTTSPLDHRSVWIEIFPDTVSKSKACAWIAARHGLDRTAVLAIGNDTNDLDLLRWAGRSLVVGNAHPTLLAAFDTVAAHDDDGFTEATRVLDP